MFPDILSLFFIPVLQILAASVPSASYLRCPKVVAFADREVSSALSY